ncbi:MAG: copper chaperone PCu(A)C [Gallionella sp.]|jgi:copper(I)-binding protein
MHKIYWYSCLLAALLLSTSVNAGDIQVEGAWSRATAPGQDVASVDLSITSKHPARLLGVSSTASSTAEMHSMTHENGVMKMREVEEIELPAGERVSLGERGYHLMLLGLKTPLKVGESIPLTLTIKVANNRTSKVKTKAAVKSLTTTKAQEDEHEKHH